MRVSAPSRIAVDVVAEAAGTLLVVADRLKHATERANGRCATAARCRHDGDATTKTWNDQRGGESRAMTPCSPFSPPVTAVHLNATSKAIWEKASVSSEKYRPLRRRMIAPMTSASSSREDDREHQRHEVVAVAAEDEERGGIARAAEEYGGAEWHEAGIADQQVHARAVERVDRDLRDQARSVHRARPESRVSAASTSGDPDRRMT